MSNNKYKILIVEDDRGIANFVQTVLETNGYQVLHANRCSQGILVFSSHIPDLVILDLGLPDMDGEEFIRQVRRIWTWVPTTMLQSPLVRQNCWPGSVHLFGLPDTIPRLQSMTAGLFRRIWSLTMTAEM